MKKYLILFSVVCCLIMSSNMFAVGFVKKAGDELLRKSVLNEPPSYGPWATSYPSPFVKTGDPVENPKDQAGISTGYYFVDSYDPAVKPWKSDPEILDTTDDANNWRRIISGPNQRDQSEWEDNPENGLRYFRNPDDPDDSTDNALAGPIPIGFNFVFNGVEYDSFYVSTNGCVALTNSRYYYNKITGARETRSNGYGNDNAYNVMSMDWFEGAAHSGDGMSDNTEDDYGWQSVTDNLPSGYGSQSAHLGGIRDYTTYPSNIAVLNHAAIIAPFFGDLHLSQYDKEEKVPRDWSKVYFYKDKTGYKLIIYFVNVMLHNSISVRGTPYTISSNKFSWEEGYLAASCQVTLDRRDSSINFVYEKFSGYKMHYGRPYEAKDVFRFSTHCGVFGYSRHLDYDSKEATGDPEYAGTLPWADEYTQLTYAWSKYQGYPLEYPQNTQSLKFKQWKNTLRVCDLSFRVRELEEDAPNFTREILTRDAVNYEILAGHDQIGQLQPVAIVENLTNDIQGPSGVNYQDQDLNFRVKCVIINQATKRPLYNKYVKVDSSAIAHKKGDAAYEKIILSKVKYTGQDYEADTMHADYYDENTNLLDESFNGIPPYGFVQIFFPPFEPNELYENHIGLMKVFVVCDPTDPRTGEGFKDMWPFDDTLSVRFWVMKQISNDESFIDDVTEFHVVENDAGAPTAIPSVFKWVSIGATVVNGDNVSRHPLPPRGDFLTQNKSVYPTYKVSSPVIMIKRPITVGIGQWGGGEIRSFPIDMVNKKEAVLSLAVQRSTNRDDWRRGYSDNAIIGCEQRVVVSNWYAQTQAPDELRVEFARPSPNWRTGEWIANIPKANWRNHPRRGGAKAETKMSAYTLFGGGGHMVGFLESDPDSAMAAPVTSGSNKKVNGLRYDFYDDGIDFEYQKINVQIPDTFIRAENDGASHFRFRVQVYAKNHQRSPTMIADDEDKFYIDNVRILHSQDEDVDIEVTKVEAIWPYTIAPASQAIAVPLEIQLTNNTSYNSPSFWAKIKIVTKKDFEELYFYNKSLEWRGDPADEFYQDSLDKIAMFNQIALDSARIVLDFRSVYCRIMPINVLRPKASETISLPNWNARENPPGEYILIGNVFVPGGDLEPLNDTTYSSIEIVYGPVFAYDPVSNPNDLNQAENNVDDLMQEFGRGLTLRGYKMGGIGANYNPVWMKGDDGGVGGAGQIAMKFTLFQEDTIFGYQAYFGVKSHSPDAIAYIMYDGDKTPGNIIPNSLIETSRGRDDIRNDKFYGEMVTVLLPEPIVLKRGEYWVSVQQLGEDGIEIGASSSKCGMRCTNLYYSNPQQVDKNGSSGWYLNIEKSFRKREKYSERTNKNFFAFENGLYSGSWEQFTATIGNPSYAHLNHEGQVGDGTDTYSRASWMPLIRPYLGWRSNSDSIAQEYCDDVPVELTFFRGKVRQEGIDLVWETASELRNAGFFIERRILTDENSQWNSLPEFIDGNGTTNIPQEYNFVDKDVISNTTYQYRLRQVDIDGTQTCDDFSNIVTLTYENYGVLTVEPSSPNPFTEMTNIKFNLPTTSMVTLEILDVFGNVINTLVNSELSVGPQEFEWNAVNNTGDKVPSGTYFYRLNVDNQILTGQLSLVK